MERQSGNQTGATGTAPGSTQTGDLAGTARDATDQVMQFAKTQASARLGTQIDTVCQGLGSTASSIRSLGAQMREENMGDFAGYAEQAAAQIEGVSQFLEGKDLDDLVWEAERFARNQPAIFVGGAFLLGFMASRFLRATRPQPEMPAYERYRSRMPRSESYRPAYYNPPRPMYTPSTQPAHYGSSQGAYSGSSTPGYTAGTDRSASGGMTGGMAARGSAGPSSGIGSSTPGTGSMSGGSSISSAGSPTDSAAMRGTGSTPGTSPSGVTASQGSTRPGTNQGTGSA